MSLLFPVCLLCPMLFVTKLVASSVLRGHFLLNILFIGSVSCQDYKALMTGEQINIRVEH
jgi:hypothetical protein